MKMLKQYKECIIDLSFILLGSFLGSIGINMFLTNAKLLSSGLSGIALIFQYMFNIQAGVLIIVLNIPLFILSFIKLDRRFTIYSVTGTIALSLSLILTHNAGSIINMNDKLLYCIYGGAINGIGFGIVFAHNGSTGGFDIVSMLIKKKYSNFDLGNIMFCINLIIIAASTVLFNLPIALYTLLAMYIQTFVLDHVVKGTNKKKLVFIITNKENEIQELIMTRLRRGVTLLYGEGAYTKEKRKILYCIIPLSQLPEIKKIVTTIDKKAFLTIADATEVQGTGFKSNI
ncbi:MAG: YitT family protein [Bacillota bacterium]|nr:YitT family protein [Bacillota bacterium]